jgi:hypothetical protein
MDADRDTRLTEAEREAIFRIATGGFAKRYESRIAAGMTDSELHDALAEALGVYGGSGGPDKPSVEFTGAGLRIWGGRRFVAHTRDRPLYSGKATIAMARRVYGIRDPDRWQLDLF